MNQKYERLLLEQILTGIELRIDNVGVVAVNRSVGEPGIYLSMLAFDGRRFSVPLSCDLALSLGEQMIRAADAIKSGITPKI